MTRLAPLLTISHFATCIRWSASGDDLLFVAGAAWSGLMLCRWLYHRARGPLEYA